MNQLKDQEKVNKVIAREVFPYIAVLVVALLVLTYVPWLSLWLPAVIYK